MPVKEYSAIKSEVEIKGTGEVAMKFVICLIRRMVLLRRVKSIMSNSMLLYPDSETFNFASQYQRVLLC